MKAIYRGFFLQKHHSATMKAILAVSIILCSSHVWGYKSIGGDETCETLQSEINIMKEEYDELGQLQRSCNGEIGVNKCEGSCNSQVQPSVITPTGFLKECYCCRESFLRERTVVLTHCYTQDGIRILDNDLQSMNIRIREPAECKCYKCGDFNR